MRVFSLPSFFVQCRPFWGAIRPISVLEVRGSFVESGRLARSRSELEYDSLFEYSPPPPWFDRPESQFDEGHLCAGGKAYPDAPAETVPLEMFVEPEGLEVTVWASSPQLFNPTNMDIDRDGRDPRVAEGVRYRKHFDRQPKATASLCSKTRMATGKPIRATLLCRNLSVLPLLVLR